MTNWIDKCEAAFTVLGLPYDFERMTCDTSQLPDTYIVYFLVDDTGEGYSDGAETSHQPRIQVSLYYRDKAAVLTIPEQITTALTEAGFTHGAAGRIPYQTDTGHYGWRCDFYHYERR